MLESMQREGILFEALLVERSQAQDYLLFYLRAHDLVSAQAAFAASELAIDKETRAIIAECWDTSRATPLEVALELSLQGVVAREPEIGSASI